ncbi:hypothetical protein HMPREF1869_01756 [Bacteroidales bacterium KA00251]|nr:hypothetical protein HMPREF1869_01756 [Bacteroidales bacterium KA00251]
MISLSLGTILSLSSSKLYLKGIDLHCHSKGKKSILYTEAYLHSPLFKTSQSVCIERERAFSQYSTTQNVFHG